MKYLVILYKSPTITSLPLLFLGKDIVADSIGEL